MDQKNKNLPYLDGWRGLAIVFLLIGHFFPMQGINLGSFGVNLFFVLSGLLMTRILFIDKVPISTFYRRRISRIFPAVFSFLLLIIGAFTLLGKPLDWQQILAAATFTNNYFVAPPSAGQMPFGHIWSLSVEEHSYVLLSIVAVLSRKQLVGAKAAIAFLAGACAITAVLYWNASHDEATIFGKWMHTEVAAFAIFVSGLALMYDRQWFALAGWGTLVLAAIGMMLHWWSVPAPIRTIVGCGALALAINHLTGAHPMVHAALSIRPLRQLGMWSFSIYLWQQPFYLMVHREGMPAIVGLALGICCGVASFYLIERPSRSYLNRIWTGKSVTVPSESAPA